MGAGRFELITLGTGAAIPARGRFPTAQVLNVNEALYLIDCGEGTQERIRSAGLSFQRIGHIFIGHLHGDHYLGLVGLISTMHLMGRRTTLHVYGPKELKEVLDLQLRVSGTYLRYPLHFHALEHKSGVEVHRDRHVSVTTLALRHRIPCTGFVFREVPGPRRLRKEKLPLIPHFERTAVANGEDLALPDGTRYANAELTLDPMPARSYAYCSDTGHAPELVPFIAGVDLLYHEATFTKAMQSRARETMHSTAEQAATIARDAQVGRLLLGHFSSRYRSAEVLLAEALPVFPRTELSYEGGRFPVVVDKE
ncbi:MAG: ribonuclease Z [Flavobacteriales bacterium]|nr:ribonuclease Z [Flavobacteriales bacterium]